ncbi:MAG: nitrate/nitrite transporter NrtS [Chthoniobacterales bacterium]
MDLKLRLWLRAASERAVVRRASITALIVGTILIAINHTHALLAGDVSRARLVQICLTFLVPYAVSTTSSVAASRDRS